MNPILINVKVLLNLGQCLLHILTYYIQSTHVYFFKKKLKSNFNSQFRFKEKLVCIVCVTSSVH